MFSFYRLLEELDQCLITDKICSKWRSEDNVCTTGCMKDGVVSQGSCIYYSKEKNKQIDCSCFEEKK